MYLKTLGNTSEKIAAIGLGTSIPGALSDRGAYDRLRHVVRLAVDLGMTFIDTAPAYGEGRSEEVVGNAVQGLRNRVFLATKVPPESRPVGVRGRPAFPPAPPVVTSTGIVKLSTSTTVTV